MLDFRADEQARLLRQSIPAASMTVDQLWWHYFSWGGNACQMEIDAYLHQALHLPRLERDLLNHAAHELIHE